MSEQGVEIVQAAPEDAADVLEIINYYISETFAAYPSTPNPPEAFQRLWALALPGSFIKAVEGGRVVGLAFLSPFLPADTIRRTAQVTYFIAPEHTGRGLGVRLLEHLTSVARERGVDSLLAHVSTLNPGSIRFHERQGFARCGLMENVGRKNGRDFGVVYLQKRI